jgi:hypothetical protein
MTKRQLKILEKCFSAEIESAIKGFNLPMCQMKSKLAEEMERDGYIIKVNRTLGGRFPVTIEGYCLTEMGRREYCMSQT